MAKNKINLSDPPLKNNISPGANGEEPLVPTVLATKEVRHNEAEFLQLLFRALDQEGIRYCVLHGWTVLLFECAILPDHDIDIAIHPDDARKLPVILRTLADRGYMPIQRLDYEVMSSAFVFAWFEDLVAKTVMVDFASGHRDSGLIWKSGEALVAGRQRLNGIWVAGPATEFSYILTKKISKGFLSPRKGERLAELIRALGLPKAGNIVSELLGDKHKKQVLEACLDHRLAELLPRLKPVMLRRRIRRGPSKAIWSVWEEGIRLLRRFRQPTGLSLVFLGPDGVGKSTLVTGLLDALKSAFRRDHTFHWRPGVILPIRDGDGGLANPHDQPCRGPLLSVLFLLGFFVDFWAGHILCVRPLLARSGLVIFDRYYYDILVDPKRYRYAGPQWLLRVMAHLLPRRDELVLVLDAPEEVILSRKRQLSEVELRRMRVEYRQLNTRLKQSHLIETQHGPEQTLALASRIIFDFLAGRLDSRETRALRQNHPNARKFL
jgi:thymidylate kinase